jgi:hypothetical protein
MCHQLCYQLEIVAPYHKHYNFHMANVIKHILIFNTNFLNKIIGKNYTCRMQNIFKSTQFSLNICPV